jgi:hypothetical protein
MLVGSLLYYMVSVAFFNMDYLGQDHLKSVTIYDRGCLTSFCEGLTGEMTVTSPEQLKALESAFFNKVQDVSHMTKEDGGLSFTFHYEKKDIVFHTNGIDITANIYYIDRGIVYHFNKNDLKILSELFTVY